MKSSSEKGSFWSGARRAARASAFIASVFACALGALPSMAEGGGVSVRGASILRDGRPWIARGVSMTGRVSPAALAGGELKIARAKFGVEELESIKRFGADVIRFQVSQGGNDPRSKIYSESYLEDVKSAVTEARERGFSVIVSLQAEGTSGLNEMGMPNEKAQRAWRRLAPAFADDGNVMLELFNEPSPEGPDAVQPHDWKHWKDAMQPLVSEVRELGAKNVLLLDGLYWAQMLKDAPSIDDPLGQIAYAVHPYFSQRLQDKSQWDDMFGDFAASHPVMITEWSSASFLPNCNSDSPRFAENMLNYLKTKKLGLVAWAFDFPRSLFRDSGSVPTNFAGFHCGPDTDFGAGELIAARFRQAGE